MELTLKEIDTITYISDEVIENENTFYLRFYNTKGEDNIRIIEKWKFLSAKLTNKIITKLSTEKRLDRNTIRKMYQNIDFLNSDEVELVEIDLSNFQSLPINEKYEYCDMGGSLSDRLYRDIYLRKILFYPENVDSNYTINKIWFMDIEVFRNFEYTNPEPNKETHFINSISIYSTITNTLYILIYKNDNIVKSNITLNENVLQKFISDYTNYFVNNIKIEIFNSEIELLKHFNDLVKKEIPEVISGWNVFFDVNFIIDKMNYFNFSKNEIFYNGYLEKENFNMGKNIKWYLPKFINVIDYLSVYKLYNKEKPEKFSLDSVAEFELNLNKVKFDDTLDILYRDNIDNFIEYNVIDTIIVKLLDDKLKLIDFIFKLSTISLLPLYKFNFKNIGKIVEGVIFRYSKLNKDKMLWIKNSLINKKKKEENEESYKGAFVKQPEKSGCFYYISDLDATSLYPSIISNFNISPETFLCKIEPLDNIYSNQEIIKIIKNDDLEKAKNIMVHIYDFHNNKTNNPITLKDVINFIKSLSPNFSITDNLSIFIFDKNSVYKNIIKEFKKKRKNAKNIQLRLIELKEKLTNIT